MYFQFCVVTSAGSEMSAIMKRMGASFLPGHREETFHVLRQVICTEKALHSNISLDQVLPEHLV